MEHQRREGIPAADAGEGALLPESIVRTLSFLSLFLLYSTNSGRRADYFTDCCWGWRFSWSKQIIEHERAEAAKEAAAAAAAKEQQQ